MKRTEVEITPPLRSPMIQWLQNLSEAIMKTECRTPERTLPLADGLERLGEILLNVRREGRDLYWVGNGGSLAICSHLAQDALNKLKIRSRLLQDPAQLTCFANDYGYSEVFLKPLQTLARPGDVLIGISSSGNSTSILKPLQWAIDQGLQTVGFSSLDPSNLLRNLPCDLNFYLPAELYGHAEVGHEALIHSALECLHLRDRYQIEH